MAQGGSRTNFRGGYKDNGRAAASGEWSLYKRADWWKMLGVKGEPQIWRTCRSVSFIRIFQTPPLVLASANHDTAGNDDLLESTYGVSHRPVMTYVERRGGHPPPVHRLLRHVQHDSGVDRARPACSGIGWPSEHSVPPGSSRSFSICYYHYH